MAATSLLTLHTQQSPGRSAAGWRWRMGLLWAVACCLAATAPLQAVPFTIPTGLLPGEHYRLAFVTSTTRNATSTNIADYNAFVTTVANTQPALLALGTTWLAIASTVDIDARDNTDTNNTIDPTGVPIYLLNNTKLADTYADLWDGSIDTNLAINEDGATVPTSLVWTGTQTFGVRFTFNALGTAEPVHGTTDAGDGRWIAQTSSIAGTQLRPFYGVSGDLTVPAAVPEPGTFMLLGSGLGGLLLLLAWRRTRRRARAVVSATPGAH